MLNAASGEQISKMTDSEVERMWVAILSKKYANEERGLGQ